MRYKLLFISSWFPNKLEPTNGNFVQRHAEAVSTLHDVEVLHAIGDSKQKELYIFDEKIINGLRILIVYYKKTSIPLFNFFLRMKAYQKGFAKMNKPDLIHANVLNKNLLFAVWLKLRYSLPFVVSAHSSSFLEINHFRVSFFQKKIISFIANQAEWVLPVSNHLKEGLKKLGVKGNIKIIGNVINTDLFKLSSAPKKKNEDFVFLHISNLVPLKNADKIILSAVKLREKYKNFSLQIGGDGDVALLSDLILKHNASSYIHVFDRLTYEGVAKKMKAMDCFILFSDYETQGCVVLEAFSCGKPVVSSKAQAVSEIVDESRGVLIEQQDIKNLSIAMEKVLLGQIEFDDPERIRNYVVNKFSKQKIAEMFSEKYHQILQ